MNLWATWREDVNDILSVHSGEALAEQSQMGKIDRFMHYSTSRSFYSKKKKPPDLWVYYRYQIYATNCKLTLYYQKKKNCKLTLRSSQFTLKSVYVREKQFFWGIERETIWLQSLNIIMIFFLVIMFTWYTS